MMKDNGEKPIEFIIAISKRISRSVVMLWSLDRVINNKSIDDDSKESLRYLGDCSLSKGLDTKIAWLLLWMAMWGYHMAVWINIYQEVVKLLAPLPDYLWRSLKLPRLLSVTFLGTFGRTFQLKQRRFRHCCRQYFRWTSADMWIYAHPWQLRMGPEIFNMTGQSKFATLCMTARGILKPFYLDLK